MPFQHVLITTDFSDDSEKSLDFLLKENKLEFNKATIVHVGENIENRLKLRHGLFSDEEIETYEQEYFTEVNKKLAALIKDAEAKNKLKTELIETINENTAQAICEYARNNSCDLIVIAKHGRGLMEKLILGSTTERVLKLSPCPVLVLAEDQ